MAAIGECMTVRSFVRSFSFHHRSSNYLSYFYYCFLLLFLRNLFDYCINYYYCLLFPKSNRTSQSHPQKTSSILVERDFLYARERKSEFIFPTCPSNPDGQVPHLDGLKRVSVLPHFQFLDVFLVSTLFLKPLGISIPEAILFCEASGGVMWRNCDFFPPQERNLCSVRLIVP